MRGGTGGFAGQLQKRQCECVIGALESSPWVGVFLVDAEGRIEYVTKAASEILFRCEPRHAVGRTLGTLLPDGLGEGLRNRMKDHPVHGERVILGGWQLLITCSAEVDDSGQAWGCTVQRVAGMLADRWEGLDIHFADCADFGRLDALSVRELEIAAFIGAGLSVRDMASHLHRSVKTIENHRISMGRKLGVASRLEIALMAHNAGLRPRDSALRRLAADSSASR